MGRFTFASRYCEAGRLLGAVLGRALIGPRAVSLEVTHHCNLRCMFCESHGSLRPVPITAQREYAGGRRVMDLPTIRRLAKEFARERVDLVQLSGKGDPIAHPEMTEIVAVIKESGVGCALVTNGTLASPDFAPALGEARLDRLTVLINAGTREVYRRISGSDVRYTAVSAVRTCLTRRLRQSGMFSSEGAPPAGTARGCGSATSCAERTRTTSTAWPRPPWNWELTRSSGMSWASSRRPLILA